MRLIVADHTGRVHGGRQRYADDFLRYLSTHHADVAVVRAALPLRDSLHRVNGPVRVLALSPTAAATHYQLHGGLLSEAFAAERASLPSRARRALFAPALRFNRHRQRLLADEARVLQGSALLMVFSEAMARELVTSRGVSPGRVCVSRPGVDLGRFHPVAESSRDGAARALHLAFVGHNFALKGLPAAISALGRLRRGGIDAILTVAGCGAQRAARRWAEQHNVLAHVRLAGQLHQDAIAALYRSCDALVHPTFYDPFPRVVVEALASGCPVVTTSRSGAAEVIVHGQEGLLIDRPDDAETLTAALAVLADADVRRRMRQHAAILGRRFDERDHFRATCAWLFAEENA